MIPALGLELDLDVQHVLEPIWRCQPMVRFHSQRGSVHMPEKWEYLGLLTTRSPAGQPVTIRVKPIPWHGLSLFS